MREWDVIFFSARVKFISLLLEEVNQRARLIDVGCGSGCATLPLHDMGFQPLGLDINQLALMAFQQKSKDVPLVQGDALHLPIHNGSIGCVVATHLFEHVDRAQFLRECHRVLCDDGLLIFDAINRHSYKLTVKRLGRFLGLPLTGRPSDKWIDVFSCREVLQLIVRVGFDLQTISGYGWIPFSVDSDSRLVYAMASVERFLRLDSLPHVSPRILMAVRKRA